MSGCKKAFCLCFQVIGVSAAMGEIFLPGMQPKEAGIEFAKVQQCQMCHGKTKNGDADPVLSWQGGMMAQAARDPIFLATMTIANQDFPGAGEFCLRCHTPRGWLEDRSTSGRIDDLNQEDMHGVSCDVCHRFIDPMSNEAKLLVKDPPPGYGNAMMVADPENTVRGPYGNGKGAMPHKVKKSDFHASGNLCGTCHDISNPVLATDIKTQPVHSFAHLERTYSEWLLSDFAKQGKKGSCQSCHYPQVKGGGQASRFGKLKRAYFVQHGPVGGSTWVQDAIAELWPGEINKKALKLSKKRAEALLKTAATLEATAPKGDKLLVRVTNQTGHKLPSGYPEGRRMWLNVKFLNGLGLTIKEVGIYGDKADTLNGKDVKVPTLLDPEETTVYEVKPAISEKMAKQFNKQPGPSFHFVLNDIISFDNRIPPKGFNNEKFREHLCGPVGVEYADNQYWHVAQFDVPKGTKKVKVKLMYQSMSWEYLQFLVEENKTDDWGKKLYETWNKTGKCKPTVMNEIETKI